MCSKLFGKGTGLSLIGDLVGGGLGFLAGGPLGAGLGAAVGGGLGEAAGGGSLIQDIQAAGLGGAVAGGIGLGADALAEGGLAAGLGAADAGAAGASAAGDVAAPAISAAPGVVSDAAVSTAVPAASTYGPVAGLSAASEAAPTTEAALGVDLSAAPGASFATGAAPAGVGGAAAAADPLAATEATFGQTAFSPTAFGLNAGEVTAAPAGGFFSPVTDAIKGAGDFLASPTGKLVGAGVSGLGLARNLLTAPNIQGSSQLQQLATQLGQEGASLVPANAGAAQSVAGQATAQAATLENYLNTGTLPPQIQASLDQATNSAIQNLKASYAAKGESADPNQNTQLAAGIASIQQNAVIQGGTLAASLYSQGVTLDQLASQIYGNLVSAGTGATASAVGAQQGIVANNTATNTGLNTSIANLSSALGGGNHAIINGSTVALA